MKSALRERLRFDGEDRLPEMVTYAMMKITAQRAERDATFDVPLGRFTRQAAGDFADRRSGELMHGYRGSEQEPLASSIFQTSNLSLQIPRSVKRFLMSRVYKDLFGSRPWLAATPRRPYSKAEAEEIQKHGEYKMMECGWQERMRDALSTTLDLGFCFVKTTWDERWDVSERLESILFDGDASEPVSTQAGDYLFADDDTEEAGAGAADGPAEEGAETPRVFSKEPSIPAPSAKNKLSFKPHLIEDKERLYAGLDASPLHWKDVTWPINCAALDLGRSDCDFISVTKGIPLQELRSTYDPDGTNEEMQALFTRLKGAPSNPKSEDKKPKTERNETEVAGTDPENPIIKINESYFRRKIEKKDKAGNVIPGPESRIFLVIAEEFNEAVWIDYLAAISPRAQAPVSMMAVNQVPGRAYGIGLLQTFEMASNGLDRLLNCIVLHNEEHANPEKFVESDVAESINAKGESRKGPGIWQTVESRAVGEKPLSDKFFLLDLPDLDERTWKLMELFMQLIQVESGVTNANQGDVSDLPSNATATGINSMLESSSVLHQFILEEIRSALTPSLRYAIELVYFRQDTDEVFYYLQGDNKALADVAQAQAQVNAGPPQAGEVPQPGVMTYQQAQQLANLPMNVEILLSRAKRQEIREAAMAAIPLQQNFFTLPPQVQKYALPLIKMAFAGNGIDNPDQYFPTSQEIEASIAAAAAADQGKTPAEKIQLRENLNYADAPPSIKRQIEQEAGFTPATSPEDAAWEQSNSKAALKAPRSDNPAEEKAEPKGKGSKEPVGDESEGPIPGMT